MNPLAMIPALYRGILYLIAGIANLVVLYLAATGRVGANEVALVAGIITFLGLSTAGSNLTRDEPKPADTALGGTDTPIYDKLSNERGAIEAGNFLVALACLVIILVGLVWLVRAF